MKSKRKAYLFLVVLMALLAALATACSSTSGTDTGPTGTSEVKPVTKETPEGKPDNSAQASQEPITLVFGTTGAATNPPVVKAFGPWLKYLEAETNGRIKGDLQPGGILGGTRETLKNLGGGVYDAGDLLPNYTPDTPLYPATVVDLPFAWFYAEDHYQVYEVIRKYSEEFRLKDAFEEAGVKLLGLGATDGYVFVSRVPIRTVEDLKGLKVRAPTASWVATIEAWGAVPVSVSNTDAYVALERGTIDANMNTPGSTLAYHFHEIAPYITDANFLNFGIAMAMSPSFYDKLPEDLKARFDGEFAQKSIDLVIETYANGRDESIAQIAEEIKGKGEVFVPTAEERATFMEAGKSVWKEWAEKADQMGYDGKALLSGFVRIMEEEGMKPPYELDFLE